MAGTSIVVGCLDRSIENRPGSTAATDGNRPAEFRLCSSHRPRTTSNHRTEPTPAIGRKSVITASTRGATSITAGRILHTVPPQFHQSGVRRRFSCRSNRRNRTGFQAPQGVTGRSTGLVAGRMIALLVCGGRRISRPGAALTHHGAKLNFPPDLSEAARTSPWDGTSVRGRANPPAGDGACPPGSSRDCGDSATTAGCSGSSAIFPSEPVIATGAAVRRPSPVTLPDPVVAADFVSLTVTGSKFFASDAPSPSE